MRITWQVELTIGIIFYILGAMFTGVYYCKRHENRPMSQSATPVAAAIWPLYWIGRFMYEVVNPEPLPPEEAT